MFDFRQEEQKALLKEFGNEKTFKDDLNVWEDNVRIVASEEVSTNTVNNAVVYEVIGFNKILHILTTSSAETLSEKNQKSDAINFIFYEAKQPFERLESDFSIPITTPSHYRRCGMLA